LLLNFFYPKGTCLQFGKQLQFKKIPIEESDFARKSFAKYFKAQQPTFLDKAKYKLNLLKAKYFGK